MRIRWKPQTRRQELALAAACLFLALIFMLGEVYWYGTVEREDALALERVYRESVVHRRRNRDHHIEVFFEDGVPMDIPSWCTNQAVEVRLEQLEADTPVRLLAHPNSDIVLEMTTPTETILDFETSQRRLTVQRRGMMALGSVQNQYLDGTYSMSCAQETYAAADRAVIAIIRQCHEDARRMLEENRELLDKIAAYLLKKETITGQEMMAIIEGRDPETVDNYGATREEKQPLFRPSSPEVIEAPAKHIHIVSKPVPSPEEPQTPEEKSPEEAQPDRDPEESEQK